MYCNGHSDYGPDPHADSNMEQGRAILNLMRMTGREILQENGQRKFGPPPDWTGPPPPKGCEVFVGHLPRYVFEDELVPIFSRIGLIYQLRLMMDFSGTSRGYGFVEYTCQEDARRAVAELNNYEIKPHKRIGVVMSKDNCRLFVGKLPKDKSGEEIRDAMSRCTANVVDVIVHPSLKDNTKNRGYAFVEYSTHRDAAMARRKLLPGKFRLFDCEIQVDWAQPEAEVDPLTMSRVTNLYVRNLDPEFECESALMELFSFAGQTAIPLRVEKVKKMRDFAFVHYETREQAEIALQLAQKDNFFGYQLSPDGRSRLQVVWAKPADRSQKARGRQFRGGMSQSSPVNGDSYGSFRQFSSPFTPAPMYHVNNRTNAVHAPAAVPDWSQPMRFPRQRPHFVKEESQVAIHNFDRTVRAVFDGVWANQPHIQAGGDRRSAYPHSSIWTPPAGLSMSPYGMPSPAASPALMQAGRMPNASPAFRAMSPFPSPNPFQNFRPYPPQAQAI